MKCQEVIELIQRHLDQELTEDEEVTMHKHLEQCEACAGMFARMAKLSEELVSLPKVAPAFSLVDQILPRLQEIDALRSEGVVLDDDGRPLNEQPVTDRPFGWFGRLRQGASYKAAGGLAAAAVLLLAVFAAIQPIGSQLDDAGEAQLDAADRAGANELANHAEAGDMTPASALASKPQVFMSGGQAADSNDASSGSASEEAPDQAADDGAPLPEQTMGSYGFASDEQEPPALEQDQSQPVARSAEPSEPQPLESADPLVEADSVEPSESDGEGVPQQMEPSAGLDEPMQLLAEQPVVTSSAEVQRLDTSLSASGELTAYLEKSGKMYRLAVHETASGAALYVGAFVETEDVPQLEWSEEEEELVFMRYKLENETFRLAVNAREKSEENIQE